MDASWLQALGVVGLALSGLLAVFFRGHQRLIENLMAQNTQQQQQMNTLQTHIDECNDKHRRCENDSVALKAQVTEQKMRLSRLEKTVNGNSA